MKTQKLFLGAAILASMFAISAKSVKQCGVSNDQITSYLRNCSHHHSTFWVQDIGGTCNTNVGIENCGTATVFVNDGMVVGHADQTGVCSGRK